MTTARRARVVWTLLDQALSSVTNFGLGVFIAREVSVREFGAFALVYSIYLFVNGASKALSSEPLVVRKSINIDRRDFSEAAGTALTIGVLVGIPLLIVGASIHGGVGASVAVLGIFLPGLLLQDVWRYCFFAAGTPRRAAANDGVWATLQALFLGTLLVQGHNSPPALIGVWGLSATICAALGCVQASVIPRPAAIRVWFRKNIDLGGRFLVEFIAGVGSTQIILWIVSGIGGLATTAALRAADIVFGPMRVIALAAPPAAIPEGVRLHAAGPGRLAGMVKIVGIALGGLAVGWTCLAIGLPDHIGTALLGASWSKGRSVLFPTGAMWVAVGFTTSFSIGLRSLGAASRSLRARLTIVPVAVTFGTIGALSFGAVGVACSMALTSALAAVVWRCQFRSALSDDQLDELNLSNGHPTFESQAASPVMVVNA